MFNVTRRVSFSVVIALLLGWGAMSTMIFQSSNYLLAAETTDGQRAQPVAGVRLAFQIDKRIYRGGEPILISLRNDSRMPITVATNAGGCGPGWWWLQQQGTDELEWRDVSRGKTPCTGRSSGLEAFAKGTLKTEEWNGLVMTEAIGEVFQEAPTGTYRLAAPFLVGREVTETDWETQSRWRYSPVFTIQ